VWTEQHKKYLLEYNPDARVFNVGSILFRPKRREVEIHPLPKNSILIFDVTPFDGLGTEVLYSKRIVTDFVEDIIFALNSCVTTNNVYLKPKRNYTQKPVKDIAPSKSYLEFINQLHQSKKLQILESSLNLYEIIDGALLVIGIPFTSPVILAKEMKVESIYYIPDSAQDWIIGSIEDGIKVIQGREELTRYVRSLFYNT
jgi:polysaccharide biosynthesis PFTS motif protein